MWQLWKIKHEIKRRELQLIMHVVVFHIFTTKQVAWCPRNRQPNEFDCICVLKANTHLVWNWVLAKEILWSYWKFISDENVLNEIKKKQMDRRNLHISLSLWDWSNLLVNQLEQTDEMITWSDHLILRKKKHQATWINYIYTAILV